MLKPLIILLAILYSTNGIGQPCFCETDTTLSNVISCEPIHFDNKAKLYWSFNCDSSWLTFESPAKQRRVLYSLGNGLQGYTGRLGHIYIREYRSTFLIQHNVISGCCQPPEFYLYDKVTGKLKRNLGRIIFYSDNKNSPIIIAVTNSSYNSSNAMKAYESLTIYNIDKGKTYLLKLPKREIDLALRENEEMYPEHLFEEPIIDNGIVTLTYRKSRLQKDSLRQISINLKKYN